MNILQKLSNYYERFISVRSSASYIKYLRKKGIKIGEGTYFQDPKNSLVDITRPSLVTIGANCFFNSRVTILTHDWVTRVFLNLNLEFLNSSGHVTIGNNVSFGQNVMVLKGVTIGNNCLAAGSLVTHDIPDNTIAGGVPAKVLSSLNDYYEKRKINCRKEAFEYAHSIVDRYNRLPVPTDFWEEFPLFVDSRNISDYESVLPIKKQLGKTYDVWLSHHKAPFDGFDDFLRKAGI